MKKTDNTHTFPSSLTRLGAGGSVIPEVQGKIEATVDEMLLKIMELGGNK